MALEDRSPNPIDLHVGGMVRARRKLLSISQETLADSLKLTFQQVQKYERGANRVSASKLYEIARALGTTPAYFFTGLPGADEPVELHNDAIELVDLFGATGGVQIAKLFTGLRVDQRLAVIRIVEAIAEASQPQDQAIAA
jgi:transcriptional regulator with XRE-family HTH domain